MGRVPARCKASLSYVQEMSAFMHSTTYPCSGKINCAINKLARHIIMKIVICELAFEIIVQKLIGLHSGYHAIVEDHDCFSPDQIK